MQPGPRDMATAAAPASGPQAGAAGPASPPAPGFGPPGLSGSRNTLTLRGFRITVSGMELHLLVDDGGAHTHVVFGDFHDEARQRMELMRMGKGPGSPSVVPLRIPFDWERVVIDLVDRDGETTFQLSCVFDVEFFVFLPYELAETLPLGRVSASSSPSPPPSPSPSPPPSPAPRPPRAGLAPPRRPAAQVPAALPQAGSLTGWGPPGRSAFPRAVTMATHARKPSGEHDMKLAVDDGGRTASLRLTLPGRRKPVDLQLPRPQGPTGPGMAWLVLPGASTCLGLEFLDAEGAPIPPLACRVILRNDLFLPPGDVTSPTDDELRADPALAELMARAPDAGYGPPGSFLLENTLSVTGVRPCEGGVRMLVIIDDPLKHVSVRWATDVSEGIAVEALRRVGLFGDAGPGVAELRFPAEATTVYLEPLDASGVPSVELTAAFSLATGHLGPMASEDEEAAAAPGTGLPPDFRLLARPAFGPPGLVLKGASLTCVGAWRDGDGPLRIHLMVDDGGHHSRVCFWQEGWRDERETFLVHATTTAPAVAELVVPSPTHRIHIDLVDRFDRISDDLACVLDLRSSSLVPVRDRESPASDKYPLRERLRATTRICSACRKAKKLRDVTHVNDLPPSLLAELAARNPVDWDHCHLCNDCRPRVEGGIHVADRIGSAIDRTSQILNVTLTLGKAYLGSLLVCIFPGQFVVGLLQGTPLHAGPGAATFMAATFWATVFAVTPLVRTWTTVKTFTDWLVGNDLMRQFLSTILTPVVVLLLSFESWRSFEVPFGAPRDGFLLTWELFLASAFSGVFLAVGAAAAMGRAVEAGTVYREQWEGRLRRAERIMRALHRLIRVRGRDELAELLRELLVDHMGVAEYVVLESRDGGKTFLPTVVVGSDPSELNGLVVTSGSPGLAGQAALFGRTLDRETYEAGLDDVTVDSKLRSEIVIPVVVEGTTESLVCLNRFDETGYDEDTMAFADTLALVLGAGMANVTTLQHKDRQVQEAVEDKMAAEAKASFLKQAFSRTVAPAVVEKILASPEDFRTGGERRILTVFYSDIRSFTSLSEKVTADGMVGLLNDYLEAMARLVFKHEGTIDKWIGDAVMAFFGAPHDQPDHARRAIAMSIEMQQTLARLNEGWHSSGRFAELGVPDYPGLKIGIGLHSGEANVGFLGAKSSRVDYTAIGDTVNTAARLVSKAAADEIVISRATVEAAGVGFRFEELEPMMLKGKAEPVSTFKVLY